MRRVARGRQPLDLVLGVPEDEDVLGADLFADLHVRAVKGADGEGAVQGRLHVPGARGLGSGGGDLLAQVAGGEDHLGQRHGIVRQEGDGEAAAGHGVVRDALRHGVDELDAQLGHPVSGRGLAREDHGAGHEVGRIRAEPLVKGQGMHRVHELALVFVEALDLAVEHGVRVEVDAVELHDPIGEDALVDPLHRRPLLAERLVLGHRRESSQLVEVADPARSDRAGDEDGESGVGLEQPSTRRDPIGLVRDSPRKHAIEIRERLLAQDLGMQRGHAVHRVASHEREVRHAHVAVFAEDGGAPHEVRIAERRGLRAEPAVDLLHDVEVAGQEPSEEVHRPPLERLGLDGVVGVAEDAPGEIPRFIPGELVLVDEDAHQLGDAEDGMGVVQLDRDLPRQVLEVARPEFQEAPQDVLQRRGHEEVLLLEPQFPARALVVGRVEHLRDVLALRLVLYGAHVIALVEDAQIKLAARLGRPQAQGVDGVVAEAHDRSVVGHGPDFPGVDPACAHPAVRVGHVLAAPVEPHRKDGVGAGNLPGISVPQPVVGGLDLGAVDDLLLEDAVLVADAVAVEGQSEGRRRIQDAGGEAPEAAIAEARVPLLLLQRLEVVTELAQGLDMRVTGAEIHHVVLERAPHKEFEGQVVDALRVRLVIGALRLEPPLHQAVAHRVGDRHVGVEVACVVAVLRHRVHHPLGETRDDAAFIETAPGWLGDKSTRTHGGMLSLSAGVRFGL